MYPNNDTILEFVTLVNIYYINYVVVAIWGQQQKSNNSSMVAVECTMVYHENHMFVR